MQKEKEEKEKREKEEERVKLEEQKRERQRQQEEEAEKTVPSQEPPCEVKTEVKEEPPVQERKSKSRFGGFVSGGQLIPGAPLPPPTTVIPPGPPTATSFSQATRSPGPSALGGAGDKGNEDQWFKAALDKARTIAQSIAKPSTAEPTTLSQGHLGR